MNKAKSFPSASFAALLILFAAAMPASLAVGGLAEPEPRSQRGVEFESLPAELKAQAGFDPEQSSALFVGIRHFTVDNRFAEVPYAVDDAVDLAHLFALELNLVAPDRVVLCLSGQPQKPESAGRLRELQEKGAKTYGATLSVIFNYLAEQARKSRAGGIFLVGAATHGFTDEGIDFLVVADSLRQRIRRTGLKVTDLLDDVADAQAKRKIVLLDACKERLNRGQRAGGADPESIMGQAFDEAIAKAEGQVVLAGATSGGYSYDDDEKKNGVFSAALIEGLKGKARTNELGFVTVQTLAQYVDDSVRRWVEENRPDDTQRSRGITRHLEGKAAEMPLAVDRSIGEANQAYIDRRRDALQRLRQNIGDHIDGYLFDRVKNTLPEMYPLIAPSRDRVDDLLKELDFLDGDVRSQRIFAAYFDKNWREGLAVAEDAVPGDAVNAGQSRLSLQLDKGAKIQFAQIKAGEFRMGSPDGRRDERPVRIVRLSQDFQLGKYEITQAQWEAVMGSHGSSFSGPNRPVEKVSWDDVQDFMEALNQRKDGYLYRLPTEAEWEYAARAGSTDDSAPDLGQSAWYLDNSADETHDVGQKPANPWGLHDMLGNVWEWVSDWHEPGYYGSRRDPDRDPSGPTSGSSKVIRGGGWVDESSALRFAARDMARPSARGSAVGFRLLRRPE